MSDAPDLADVQRLIFDVLREELLEVGDDFTMQSDLVDAGLDSLAATQLLLALEDGKDPIEVLGVEVVDTDPAALALR